MNRIANRSIIILICTLTFTNCKHYTNSNNGNKSVQHLVDSAEYNRKMILLSNNDKNHLWPPKTPFPLAGAILPFKRIIAFYGNLYDNHLGILGELPKTKLIQKLRDEAQKWKAADTTTPVVIAFHCIAVMAWDEPNEDGKYRDRISFMQIDTLLQWTKELNGLVFLDIQVGTSTLQEEIPPLESYLIKENIHLGIDPEFSMKNGPLHEGQIGSFNAHDINYAIDYLAEIVKKYHLPPKILVVHRFTADMVVDYDKIKKVPEVQVIMDMDGFGSKAGKKDSYNYFIYQEPVEFTGFKLFYKNDVENDGTGLMTPKEILNLIPKPIYIQYQ